MRVLFALVATTEIAAASRPCPPGDDDCPPQPVKLVHPLFAWHAGLGGGPSVGFLWDLADGGHDPATRRLVVGWQQRVVRLGRPADLLIGLHLRWSDTFVVQPSIELATSLPGPLGAPGLA